MRDALLRIASELKNTAFAGQVDAVRRNGLARYEPWPLAVARERDASQGSGLFDLLHKGIPVPRGISPGLLADLRECGLAAPGPRPAASPGHWEVTSFDHILAVRDRAEPVASGAVYLGEDSLRFVQTIRAARPFGRGLDVGAGSGISACAMALTCDDVTAIDVVPDCVQATVISAGLNGLSDRVDSRLDSLEDLAGARPFSCIAANLPGVPVPPGMKYSVEGDGGPDGLRYMRDLLRRCDDLLDPDWGLMLMRMQSLGDADGPMMSGELAKQAKRRDWDILIVSDSKIPVETRAGLVAHYATPKNPDRTPGELLDMADEHLASFGLPFYYASSVTINTSGSGRLTFRDLGHTPRLDAQAMLTASVSATAKQFGLITCRYYAHAGNLPESFWELGDLAIVRSPIDEAETILTHLRAGSCARQLCFAIGSGACGADPLRARSPPVTSGRPQRCPIDAVGIAAATRTAIPPAPKSSPAAPVTPAPDSPPKAHPRLQPWWPSRPRVSTGVAPGRVHCGTGRLVGPQVAFPSESERQYQHGPFPSGQPSGLSCQASRRP